MQDPLATLDPIAGDGVRRPGTVPQHDPFRASFRTFVASPARGPNLVAEVTFPPSSLRGSFLSLRNHGRPTPVPMER